MDPATAALIAQLEADGRSGALALLSKDLPAILAWLNSMVAAKAGVMGALVTPILQILEQEGMTELNALLNKAPATPPVAPTSGTTLA